MTRVLVLEGEPSLMRLLSWSLGEAGLDVTTTSIESFSNALVTAFPDIVAFNRSLSLEERTLVFGHLARLGRSVPVIDLAPVPPDLSHELTATTHLAPPHRAAAIIDQIHALAPGDR